MPTNNMKERVLQLKLQLHFVQTEKNISIRAQCWEKAAALRYEETLVVKQLVELREEILSMLASFDYETGTAYDYSMLQELLIEFQPFLFGREVSDVKDFAVIDGFAAAYRQQCVQMHGQLGGYLQEAYENIRSHMHRFKEEGDGEAALQALERLKKIADLFNHYNRYATR